ncbi:MAG: SHOCT domain-containing protein [Sediminibacterium sp.]
MKYFLVIILLACNTLANAQQPIPKIENDSLYTTSGLTVGKGQKIKLGLGTMPDGDFKFIRINSSSIFHNTEISNYNSGYNANNANSMNRRNSWREFTVVRLERRGDDNHGYTYYVVVAGVPRYEVDIENAIACGELVLPTKFKTVVSGQSSMADELGKFKKLLDAGALTAEEFDIQKKKILNKN